MAVERVYAEFFAHYFPEAQVSNIRFLDKEFLKKLESYQNSLEADLLIALEVQLEGQWHSVVVCLEHKSWRTEVATTVMEYAACAWLAEKKPVWSIVFFTDEADWREDIADRTWLGYSKAGGRMMYVYLACLTGLPPAWQGQNVGVLACPGLEHKSWRTEVATTVMEYAACAWLAEKKPVWSIVFFTDEADWREDIADRTWLGYSKAGGRMMYVYLACLTGLPPAWQGQNVGVLACFWLASKMWVSWLALAASRLARPKCGCPGLLWLALACFWLASKMWVSWLALACPGLPLA